MFQITVFVTVIICYSSKSTLTLVLFTFNLLMGLALFPSLKPNSQFNEQNLSVALHKRAGFKVRRTNCDKKRVARSVIANNHSFFFLDVFKNKSFILFIILFVIYNTTQVGDWAQAPAPTARTLSST